MEISDIRELFGDDVADISAKSSLLTVLLKKLPEGWRILPLEHAISQDVVDHADQFIGIRMHSPGQIVRSLADTVTRAIAGYTYNAELNDALADITRVDTDDEVAVDVQRQRYVDFIENAYKHERGEGILNIMNVRHNLQQAMIDIGLPEGNAGDYLKTYDQFLRSVGSDKYAVVRNRFVPQFGDIYCKHALTKDQVPVGEHITELSERKFDLEFMKHRSVGPENSRPGNHRNIPA